MTPPWVRSTNPPFSRRSRSRRTVDWETFSWDDSESRSLMPRRASNSLRRACRSAINIGCSALAVAVASEIVLDAAAGVGQLLRGGHLLEVGGPVRLLREPVGGGQDARGNDAR